MAKSKERVAVLIGSHPTQPEGLKRHQWIYPPVTSATGDTYYVARSYTTEDYHRDFPVGSLVVLECTHRKPFDRSLDEYERNWGKDKYVWKLVNEIHGQE